MTSMLRGCRLMQRKSFQEYIRFFSYNTKLAGDHKGNVYEYRKRWVKNDDWPKNRYTGKPWAPNVPMEQSIDLWREDNSYFGAYDFIDILGNDLNMDPNVLCKGPLHIRGQKLTELQRLLKRRETFGGRMHAESLNQIDKRIHYLLKRQSRVRHRRTRHKKIDDWVVPVIKERFE